MFGAFIRTHSGVGGALWNARSFILRKFSADRLLYFFQVHACDTFLVCHKDFTGVLATDDAISSAKEWKQKGRAT